MDQTGHGFDWVKESMQSFHFHFHMAFSSHLPCVHLWEGLMLKESCILGVAHAYHICRQMEDTCIFIFLVSCYSLSLDCSPSIWICMGMQNRRCCECKGVGKVWAWEMGMDTSQDHKALPAIYILHAHCVCTSESSRSVSPSLPNEKPNATVLRRSHENLCMQATTEHPQDRGREIWAWIRCSAISSANLQQKRPSVVHSKKYKSWSVCLKAAWQRVWWSGTHVKTTESETDSILCTTEHPWGREIWMRMLTERF